ncbi:MAG: bifunctional aldolase/short-chain dehydrogenase [Nannocystaceae bacterium]
MDSAWSEAEARAAVSRYTRAPGVNEDLALRVYSSRLIGAAPGLVLHGGGNTSVKTRLQDDLGDAVDVLCVKGSGWDLGRIEPQGFPAIRLESLGRLRGLSSLSDEAMVNAARTRMLDAQAPNPSVETLLHAFLPHKFIDHSHADAILAVVDQPEAAARCRDVFGERLAIVPYIMPGFALAKLAAEVAEAHPDCEGLLLLQHGLFTFGATARESYERHIAAVTQAEDFVARRRGRVALPAAPARDPADLRALAPTLRGRLGEGARRYVLHWRRGEAIDRFVDDPAVASLSQRGPVTPDHVIRTKQRPLLLWAPGEGPDLRDAAALAQVIEARLADYRARYRAYFARQVADKGVTRVALDPDPRVILIPGVGLVTAGESEAAARVAADLYERTIQVIDDAEVIGAYQALPDGDIFDMEYWSLEQAKLGKQAKRPLAGQVVYVSGAARGIGLATARAFVAQGAHLFLADRDDAALQGVARELGCPFMQVDVRDGAAIEASVDAAVERFGGLDGIVSNAGVAPQGPIAGSTAALVESVDVNLLGHQRLAAAAVRVMMAQGTGGFLLFNASKAALNPGASFGPYAVAKAALVALMRQYALEGAAAGIRSNAVNADRVRTALLPPDVVGQRAKARGLSPDDYFKANLLAREVTAEDVADAFVWLAKAASTTGAIVPVDGGNLAAAPR